MADNEALNPMQGVSGPSTFSKRVDLEYKPDTYGEGVQYAKQKSGAPLEKSAGVPGAERRTLPAAEPVTSLYAPSARREEPITSGIALGAGPGPEALGMGRPKIKLSDSLAEMLPYDTTGEVAVLYQEALARGN